MEDDGSKAVLNALSSHKKREQAKQESEEASEHHETAAELKQRRKNYFWITVSMICLILFAAGIGYLFTHKKQMYADKEVHWHALFDVEICGKKIDLPCENKGEGIVHGETFCGLPNFHHHFDNTLHIEGVIEKKEDILLGKFFDIIGVPFDKDKIMDKKNGDLCDGQPSTLKMYVNDQPRTDFRDFIPYATPDANRQVIKLVFGPDTKSS